ncbi:uncharacterized protein LOC127913220 [Oncorhynchus keta]|uniref:uncharacterized protein LOC127913220 n=1 Tax=Oncorhynchus keta TaxID=8018 RepID=UPI00227AFA27|nr:uncharacterized protein LOC127913220 [Oncorhynchus keta]
MCRDTGVVVYTGQCQYLIQCAGVLEWLYIQVSVSTLFNVQGYWSGCIYRSVSVPYSMCRGTGVVVYTGQCQYLIQCAGVLEWLYIQVSASTLFNVQGYWSGCIYRSVSVPYSMCRGTGVVVYTGQYQYLIQCAGVLEWLYIQVSTSTLFNVQGYWSGCIYRSVPVPYSMCRDTGVVVYTGQYQYLIQCAGVLEWLYIQVSVSTLFNVQGYWSGCIYRSVLVPYSMCRGTGLVVYTGQCQYLIQCAGVMEWLYIQVSVSTLFNVQGYWTGWIYRSVSVPYSMCRGNGVVVYTGQCQYLTQCAGVLEWLYIQVSVSTLFNVQGYWNGCIYRSVLVPYSMCRGTGLVVYTGQC